MCSPARDIIILLLGATGAGKSSFVNSASGAPIAKVSHSMEACTSAVRGYRVPHSKGNLLLVDTPGLNQTNRQNRSIMHDIATFLDDLDSTVHFGAILLFAPLNVSRLEIQKICAELKPTNSVTVVTVGGNDVSPEAFVQRKAALQKGKNFTLIEDTFDFKEGSAKPILDRILAKDPVDLKIVKDALAQCSSLNLQPERRRGLAALLKRIFA